MAAESQRALAQVVAGAEQEVDLREPALLGVCFASPLCLRASNETPSPPVRGTVGHRPEQGLFHRRLMLAGLEWQPGVKLVGIR